MSTASRGPGVREATSTSRRGRGEEEEEEERGGGRSRQAQLLQCPPVVHSLSLAPVSCLLLSTQHCVHCVKAHKSGPGPGPVPTECKTQRERERERGG